MAFWMVRRARWLALAVCAVVLAGCGNSAGNAAVLSDVHITPDDPAAPHALALAYHIGRDATVSISVAANGQTYTLRQNEPRSPDSYTFHFNGAVSVMDNGVAQDRVLSGGSYSMTISATARDGQTATQTQPFTFAGSTATPPAIENVLAAPETISPNFDAVDDLSTLTYRVTQPATVSVDVTGPMGSPTATTRFLKAPTIEKTAIEDKVIFNGLTENQEPLPNGVYICTITAADAAGNISRAQKQITITDAGRPNAVITYAQITPDHVARGNSITVTISVKNIGKVPLRTQGPDSGFTYSTQDSYSTIANHQYDDKAGLWRVGVDWDGGGTTVGRYPFRWGFGHDLAPDEQVTVTGKITVLRTEDRLQFFVGLIQEQIALPVNHVAATWITIS